MPSNINLESLADTPASPNPTCPQPPSQATADPPCQALLTPHPRSSGRDSQPPSCVCGSHRVPLRPPRTLRRCNDLPAGLPVPTVNSAIPPRSGQGVRSWPPPPRALRRRHRIQVQASSRRDLRAPQMAHGGSPAPPAQLPGPGPRLPWTAAPRAPASCPKAFAYAVPSAWNILPQSAAGSSPTSSRSWPKCRLTEKASFNYTWTLGPHPQPSFHFEAQTDVMLVCSDCPPG